MDDAAFNNSVRRFLKEVGVTSQREIDLAVRRAVERGQLQGEEVLNARTIVTVDGVGSGFRHLVEGKITLRGEP